jgi:hypothetical protein
MSAAGEARIPKGLSPRESSEADGCSVRMSPTDAEAGR